MMLSGVTVLVTALAVLAVIWILVLWGSRYFGPADHKNFIRWGVTGSRRFRFFPPPAWGEGSDREAIGVGGILDRTRFLRIPLTPTLSPQAGRGSSPPSLQLLQS